MQRLLYISHRLPYPPDKGERSRAFHEIKALAEHYRITLAALAHDRSAGEAADALRAWCEKVIVAPGGGRGGLVRGAWSLLRGRSVTEGFFHSRRLRAALDAEAGGGAFDLVLAYSSGTLPLALAVRAKARIMDLVDADSAKWASYADRASWPKRWLYRREAAGVRALERRALRCCDAVIVVSDAEAAALPDADANVTTIGCGVDLDYFRPSEGQACPSPSLVFTGTMDYRPNVEGVCWFVREVWPALRQAVGDLTFTVVGRKPPAAVRRLGARPGIAVTGTVPDVRPYLALSAVAVAPLHTARGVQTKVLEAMAMGKPVVASTAALEGLDVDAGSDVLRADAPGEWVEQIARLLAHADLRRRLGRAARACVEAKYAWPARMAPLVALCRRLSAGSAPAEIGAAPDGASEAPNPSADSDAMPRRCQT